MKRYKFKYKNPSTRFCEALPIGNGKLGATVFGSPDYEKIVVNDESLYSRYPKDEYNYHALSHLQEIRRLIFEDNIQEAEAIIDSDKISSSNNSSFLPLANIYMDFGHKEYSDYCRELCLNDAIHTVEYDVQGIHYKREQFVSAVSGVMTMRMTASRKQSISFALSANSYLHHHCHFQENGILQLTGKAPDESYPRHQYHEGKATPFEMLLKVIPIGGYMRIEHDRIVVENADEVIVHVVTDTGFINFQTMPEKNPHLFCEETLLQVSGRSYEELRLEHITDYRKWFETVSLELDEAETDDCFMEDCVEQFRNGKTSNRLYELYFQFGRYLLISSSRPNSVAPTNLQGIWSEDEYGKWQCAYTLNINTPMNYWMSEVTGLSELGQPLFRFIQQLSENGKQTAKVHYGTEGWCCHHNVGIWCETEPFTNLKNATRWGMWPMAGVWMCQHLWEHYLFTLDHTFLEETAYPTMKGAALFCKEFLCEHNGYLVSCPATSPENIYYDKDGKVCAASYSTTMDITLMSELFEHCIETIELLGIDVGFKQELEQIQMRLHPIPINKEGVLQEWVEDYKEAYPTTSHMSPMYGLYPGNFMSKMKRPELYEAARKYFFRRYPNWDKYSKGWGTAWRVCVLARLQEGELAREALEGIVSREIYPMLIHANDPKWPTCQVDALMGATAGIAEMLLQSHDGIIEILPALPSTWEKGSYTGFRARGSIFVSAEWENGKVSAILYSEREQEIEVRLGKGQKQKVYLKAGKEVRI